MASVHECPVPHVQSIPPLAFARVPVQHRYCQCENPITCVKLPLCSQVHVSCVRAQCAIWVLC